MDILGLEQKTKNTVECMKAKLRGHTVYPFEGQDAMMWTDKSLRHTNSILSHLKISDENPIKGDALYQDIRGRVKQYIEKGGSKGVCRARWYEPYDRLYTYTEDSVDMIVDQLVLRGSERMDATELSKLITTFPVRWVVYDNSYDCVITHQFIDGCKFSELLSVPMDELVIDWKLIPEFTYIPGVTELVGVGTGIGSIIKTLPDMKQNLSVDSNWKVTEPTNIQTSSMQISTIKWIKQYITDKYGKIPYSLVLACISTWELMRCTDKKQLTIGITGAFRDTRTFPRFNNFTAATISVKRPDGYNEMDIVTQFHRVVEQFAEFVPEMKSHMIGMYLATNVYDLNYYVNDRVDCLVSCAPTSSPATYNGFACPIDRLYMVGTSMPVYCGWWNCNNTAINTLMMRSDEIDVSKQVDVDALVDALKCG